MALLAPLDDQEGNSGEHDKTAQKDSGDPPTFDNPTIGFSGDFSIDVSPSSSTALGSGLTAKCLIDPKCLGHDDVYRPDSIDHLAEPENPVQCYYRLLFLFSALVCNVLSNLM